MLKDSGAKVIVEAKKFDPVLFTWMCACGWNGMEGENGTKKRGWDTNDHEVMEQQCKRAQDAVSKWKKDPNPDLPLGAKCQASAADMLEADVQVRAIAGELESTSNKILAL